MKIALLLTGKTTEKYVGEGMGIYETRIKRYSGFETVTIPDLKETRNMPPDEQKKKEGRNIVSALKRDDLVILLDERGKEFRTAEFAAWLEKQNMINRKRLVFVVGGPWGFAEEVLERAEFRISLSKMTFPHQLVRLLFMEQLYRAFTIIKGEPYHHE